MEIGAIDTTSWSNPLSQRPSAGAEGSFEDVLRTSMGAAGADKGAPDSVRVAAEEFVSMALVEPVLAQSRDMNMAAAPFAPGAHEKAFAPFIDRVWSKNLVKSGGWDLVDRVEQWMKQRGTGAEVSDE